MKIPHLVFPAALLAVTVAFSACSSGSPSSNPGPSNSNSGVLADNAHNVATTPVAMDATSVTFDDNSETSAFKAGDVIATLANVPNPYMRKIVSVQRANGHAVVLTQEAALSDVFKELYIDQALSFDSTSGQSSAQSVHALDDSLVTPPGIEKTFQLGKDGVLKLASNVTVDMSESYLTIRATPEFQIDMNINRNPVVKSARLVLNGGVDVHIGAKLAAEIALQKAVLPEKVWAKVSFGPFMVVGIPVTVNVELSTKVDAAMGGAASLHAGVTSHLDMSAGAQYNNGNWSAVNTATLGGSYDPVTSEREANLSVTGYPVNIKFLFKFVGAAGPFVEFDPYFGLEGKLAGRAMTLSGKYGIKGAMGGEAQIWNWKLGQLDFPLFDKELGNVALYDSRCPSNTGKLGIDQCNQAEISTCINEGGGLGCGHALQGSSSTQTICRSPSNQDVTCNMDGLFACLCPNGQYGGANAGGCVAQHCTTCSGLVCNPP